MELASLSLMKRQKNHHFNYEEDATRFESTSRRQYDLNIRLAYQFGFSAVDTVFWSSFRKKKKTTTCPTGSNWYGWVHIAAELSGLIDASYSLSELELAISLMATGKSNCTALLWRNTHMCTCFATSWRLGRVSFGTAENAFLCV